MRLPDDPEIRAALALAMRRLAVRERFTGELEVELQGQGFSASTIVQALGMLQENGLLDDARAIESFRRSRSGRRAVGEQRLREELLRRGAAESAVEEALANPSGVTEIEAMGSALASRNWGPKDRTRAGRFLHSRGFDPELISSALDARFGPESD